MRSIVRNGWLCAVLLAVVQPVLSSLAIAQGPIPPQHHVWGRFKPGAWKLARVVTENFDADGRVVSRSVTDTRTTLEEVLPNAVVLRVETTHEVAGKRLPAPAQVVQQCFNGAVAEHRAAVFRPAGLGEVSIEGHTYRCTVQEIETTNQTSKTITKVFYSQEVQPYVLRTETISKPLDDDQPSVQTIVQVFALDMPYKVLGEVKSTTHVRAVQQHRDGTTTRTLLVTCMDVPGGVVGHTSKEIDSQGRLVRRSTLELIGYEGELVEPPRHESRIQRRLFRRFRRNRD